MAILRVTPKKLKIELGKAINFFNEREKYKHNLKGWIKKYGLVNLPASVQRTVPTDFKVLYELKWWFQPFVWFKIIQITWLNAQNEGIREIANG